MLLRNLAETSIYLMESDSALIVVPPNGKEIISFSLFFETIRILIESLVVETVSKSEMILRTELVV